MPCECCGCDAPTRFVSFHQNIGALAVRFYEGIEGEFCKSCIHGYFWKFTGTNLLLGWWSYLSLVINPILILINVLQYIPCLFMEAPASVTQPLAAQSLASQPATPPPSLPSHQASAPS